MKCDEDTRHWYYSYKVHYDVGYRNTVGFDSAEKEKRFSALIAEAQKMFQPCYTCPDDQTIILNVFDSLFFCGWYATARFIEWGLNRSSKNWPHQIELIDKMINHVLEGMGGKIIKRELHEMPIVLADASDRLSLPMRKEADAPEAK